MESLAHTDRSTAAELLIAALGGFAASIFAPAVYQVLVIGQAVHKPTPHQVVCIYALSAAGGIVVLQFIDLMQRRNLFRIRDLSRGVGIGFLGAAVTIPLVIGATDIVQTIMARMGTKAPEEHQLLVVFQEPVVLDRLLVVLSAVVLAPLFEESLFRGHLQAAMRRGTGMGWLAIGCASALFALVHGIWWMMPPLFVLAVGLGFVYDRTRNIWACVLMHALFNALSLTVEYFSMKHG